MAKKATEKEGIGKKVTRHEYVATNTSYNVVNEPEENYEGHTITISIEDLVNPPAENIITSPFSMALNERLIINNLEKRLANMEEFIFSGRLTRRHRYFQKRITTYNLESPFEDKIYSVSFEKNKYISNEDDLWKVIYIMDHKEIFENTLHEFDNHINDDFINELFRKSSSHFYIDHLSNRIFTKKNSDHHYKLISLADLLEYLTINQIETLIEKGMMAYE